MHFPSELAGPRAMPPHGAEALAQNFTSYIKPCFFYRNVGQNHFTELPHQGLKTIVELKAHNNPNLKEFPRAEVGLGTLCWLYQCLTVGCYRASRTSAWCGPATPTTAASSCPARTSSRSPSSTAALLNRFVCQMSTSWLTTLKSSGTRVRGLR